MTFSTLQTLTNNVQYQPTTNMEANDDASVADRMATYYRSKGIDPSRAYDSPDDAIADFGGVEHLI